MTAPSMEDMRKLIEEHLIKKTSEIQFGFIRGVFEGRSKQRGWQWHKGDEYQRHD